MIRFQRGQTMVEYLVVAMALVSSFFIASNTDCPGYNNCISKLAGAVHDRYQGYSNAITDVHAYSDGQAVRPFNSGSGGSGESGGSGGSGGGSGIDGGAQPAPDEGLTRQERLLDDNGNDIGAVLSDGVVIDDDGNVVGSYADGVFTSNTGDMQTGSIAAGIIDQDGNTVLPTACGAIDPSDKKGRRKVRRFVYISTVNGRAYDPFTLDLVPETEYFGDCMMGTQQVFDQEGNAIDGSVLVDGWYYASVFRPPSRNGTFLTPDGEVVLVMHAERNIFTGEIVTTFTCVVLPLDWNGPSGTNIVSYFRAVNANPSQVIGLGSGVNQLCNARHIIGNLAG